MCTDIPHVVAPQTAARTPTESRMHVTMKRRGSSRPRAASRLAFALLCGLGISAVVRAQMPDPPGQVKAGQQPRHEAYLFAHMMDGDYGRLYYSVSLDGLHWSILNGGRRVFEDYRGHADICRGHDGRYYLVGNRADDQPDINFWVSQDLLTWKKHGDYVPDLKRIPGYPKALARIGAPKLFYDEPSAQYLLTWHTTHDLGRTDLPEPYWAGQRTIYATSKDLKTFSDPPRKLFAWDMATIDVIIRREGDRYFAILKDERYPTLEWTTGKTIRICSAPALLGPYSEPGPPVSPNFREAPDADSFARRQGVVPLLRAVSGRGLWAVRRRQSEGPVVSSGRRNPDRELEQIQRAGQGPSRLDAAHLAPGA